MSAFLVTSRRVAHRVVRLRHDRHPERVRDVIDGMAREFRLHAQASAEDRAIYVPCDLPAEVTDRWVRRYLGGARHGAGGAGPGGAAPSGPGPGGTAPGGTQ